MERKTPQSQETTVRSRPKVFSEQQRSSIRGRLLAVTLGLTLITITVITIVAALSARNASQRAQEISSESLRVQAETYMEQLTSSAARENDLILDRANRDVQAVAAAVAAVYDRMGSDESPEGQMYWSFDTYMHQVEGGQYMNGKEDLTTVLVPNFQAIDEAVKRDVGLGGYLEPVMQGVFENNPNAEALYFATPNEVTRYYPNIGLGELVPPDFKVTGRVWYEDSVAFNRGSTDAVAYWTSPYLDATGLGLVTTVAIPVFDTSGRILGVVGLDLTLDEVSTNIQATQILETGYSFLIDGQGKAILLPDQGYIDLLNRSREPEEFGTDLTLGTANFAPIIQQMSSGESGFSSVTVRGDELFVAYAPIPSTGWSLGTVVRAEEVLQSVALLEQDLQGASRALLFFRILPVVLAIALALLLLSVAWTNRLVDPIRELAEAAQKIGAGQWQTSVPVRSNDEIGLLADTLNRTATQLRTTFGELELRVAERTHQLQRRSLQLQTAAEAARDITTAGNLEDLLNRAVSLINERFGFYNVSLFLTEVSGDYARLVAASGEAQADLLQRGVRLRVGQGGLANGKWSFEGIVGYVISSGKPRVAGDVSKDAAYLIYSLLPDTRSEVALPLRVRQQVIGALDVQSVRPDDFDQEEVTVLQTLADQLAIAIENIRLVERLQTTLQEMRGYYQQQIQRSWQADAILGHRAYEFDQVRVRPMADSELVQASHENGDGAQSRKEKSQLIVPVKLRDQMIGYIGLESDDPNHRWLPDDIAIVEATASQAALTLENARLLAETQRQAEREQAMGHIAAQVRETLNLDSVMQTAIRQISQALNVYEAEIRLGLGKAPEHIQEQ
jgi:GAF domain-containing protein/HAMP domain-containing protein